MATSKEEDRLMYARFLSSLLVANLLSCSTLFHVAHAESTGAALRTFGIVGTWSTDCTQVRGFSRTTWEAPMLIGASTATNVYTNKGGETTTQTMTIKEATRMTEDKIKIISVAGKPSGPAPPLALWLREEGDTWESILLKVGQRYRVILSASADGKKIWVKGGLAFKKLEDGTFENTSKQTGLNEKCLTESATESLAYSGAPHEPSKGPTATPGDHVQDTPETADSDRIFDNGGVIDNETTPKLPTRESGKYEQYCRDEWTRVGVLNKQMLDYCINSNSKGYEELVSLAKTYKNLWWIEPAIGDAVTYWTKHGSRQDQMVAYEVRHQVDSFREMSFQSKQDKFNKGLYKRCFVEWNKNAWLPGNQHSINWRQVEYCYKQDR